MRSCSFPPARRSSRLGRRSGSCGSPELALSLAAPAEGDEEKPPDELSKRASRRPLAHARLGRISSRTHRCELSGRAEPREADEDRRERDVPEGDELDGVPRSLRPELEAPREGAEQEQRPEQTGGED